MLLNLHIKNMALIDEIDIDFSDNLNILTGETGAGKSIVIDSILIALGGKTPKDFVRKDAEYGMVELLFSVEDEETIEKLNELEVSSIVDHEILISRKIIGNRSISKVNGETVTLSKIREISSLIIDLHAQHEHQSLLIPSNHIKLLDRFGGANIIQFKDLIKKTFLKYSELKQKLFENNIDETEKKRKIDLLEYEKNEIKQASLKEGEDVELENEYKLAVNHKKIVEALSNSYNSIEESGYDAVDRSIREISSILEYDPKLDAMGEILATVSDLLTDFTRSARDYLDEASFSEEKFYQIEERLNLINHLKAKYGSTISDILDYGEALDAEYDQLINQDQYLSNLKQEILNLEKELLHLSARLTEERKRIAKELTLSIKSALIDLNFLDVQFDIVFEELDEFSANGKDYVYFVISTNPGESMKPLWEVASGGELSRIMLAIKSCFADSDHIETLIFDEIDVGISGRTAQMVAEKINKISNGHQVICITHLPQIAAMANHHYLIEKKCINQKTITQIVLLDQNQEIKELARLIGGVKITDTVLQSAKEMKELATKAKVN